MSKRRAGAVLALTGEEGMALTYRGSFCKCKPHHLPSMQKGVCLYLVFKWQCFKTLLESCFVVIDCGNRNSWWVLNWKLPGVISPWRHLPRTPAVCFGLAPVCFLCGASVKVNGGICMPCSDCFTDLILWGLLWFVCSGLLFKESPARGPAGSPRTQGRAGPANVPSASPITSVKKPDSNIKSMNQHFTGFIMCYFSFNPKVLFYGQMLEFIRW